MSAFVRKLSVTLLLLLCITLPLTSGAFNLTILHTNDCHARFVETSKYGSPCGDPTSETCFGGVARRYTKVAEIRSRDENVVLLDAGDQFQGTLWFYVHKGFAASYFMNKIGYDAMAIGNHEFDNGPAGLVGFLKNASFPVLSANINTSEEPELHGLVAGWTVLPVGPSKEKVGIVGYTTVDTPLLSSSGKVKFESEATAVQRGIDELKLQGVNKIIALGHAGYGVDLQLAKTLRGVDVIVGGHTNTFLYTGSSLPSNDKPVAEYPTIVTNVEGNKVLVVQDYAFGKYLGLLQVTFSDEGTVTSWSGNPVLLDKTTAQDPTIMDEMRTWQKPVTDMTNQTIGSTHVFLDGIRQHCRLQECNLGNMLADALVMTNIKHPDGNTWANASLALVNGGSIRSSVSQGVITVGDVLSLWPFQNTVDIAELHGKHLRLVLEHSVAGYDVVEQKGKFLQVSGLLVRYDLSRPDGQRVISVEARCADCPVPRYEPLQDEQVYQVLASSFIINGGDQYDMFQKYMIRHHIIGDLDSDIAVEYISKYSPIFAGLEKRILFVNETDIEPCLVTPTYKYSSNGDITDDVTTDGEITRKQMTCPPPEKVQPCVTGSAVRHSMHSGTLLLLLLIMFMMLYRKF